MSIRNAVRPECNRLVNRVRAAQARCPPLRSFASHFQRSGDGAKICSSSVTYEPAGQPVLRADGGAAPRACPHLPSPPSALPRNPVVCSACCQDANGRRRRRRRRRPAHAHAPNRQDVNALHRSPPPYITSSEIGPGSRTDVGQMSAIVGAMMKPLAAALLPPARVAMGNCK